MKTRFLNKMAGLLAVLLLFSCTGKFEEYNTDNTGFTDEQKTYDYNTFGVWLKVVQMGIYFNYDWGSGKNWHFQTMQNLNADMFSGYMHDFKPFNAGLGNTVYNLQDGWNGTMWDNTYGYIMTEIKQTEDHSRDKYPAFYAIAKILKVEIMHLGLLWPDRVYKVWGVGCRGNAGFPERRLLCFFPRFGGGYSPAV